MPSITKRDNKESRKEEMVSGEISSRGDPGIDNPGVGNGRVGLP